MRRPALLAACVAAVWATAACGADLGKVDRTIAKEPAYRGKPRYCLLVFGPEAKTKVWLVLDGDTLYVDRNGNGDLTEEGERVPMPALRESKHPLFEEQRAVGLGDIKEGDRVHTGLELEQVRARADARPKDRDQRRFLTQAQNLPDGFAFYVRISADLSWPTPAGGRSAGRALQIAYEDDGGLLAFGTSPADAPVIHFNGPLAAGLLPGQALVRGGTGENLRASITTPGRGRGATAYLYHSTQAGLVPRAVYPVADIEYPARRPGEKPPAARVALTQRC